MNLALFRVIAILAICLSPAFGQGPAQRPARNVVLIVGDDHGLQAGSYGDPNARTPNLDALARSGTRYTHAFCTTSSCSPSRGVILSGLHSHTNGLYGLQHATHKQEAHRWVRGLPNLLEAGGYRTAVAGKYHVGPAESFAFQESLFPAGQARNVYRMAEAAERWMAQPSSRPFFLYFALVDPHRAAKGYANQEYPDVRRERVDPNALRVPPFLPDLPETREDLAEYYESVHRLDQGVGRLLRGIEATGHAEDTLVIYLSDNGMPWPGCKTTMYDAGIRLPLIVRRPGQTMRGGTSAAMVSWVDITPTVLEFAQVTGPSYPLEGRSFLATLENPAPKGWDEVFGSHQFHEITMYYPMRMLRTRTHKYILNLAHRLEMPLAQDLFDSPTWQAVLRSKQRRYGTRTVEQLLHHPREELYDLERDPQERTNLAGNDKALPVLTDLRARLRAWQERTKDPWLIKYVHE